MYARGDESVRLRKTGIYKNSPKYRTEEMNVKNDSQSLSEIDEKLREKEYPMKNDQGEDQQWENKARELEPGNEENMKNAGGEGK